MLLKLISAVLLLTETTASPLMRRSATPTAGKCKLEDEDFSAKVNLNSTDTNDIVMQSLSSFGWQHLLTDVPHTICLLGQIMVVGGVRDFSLITTAWNISFVHMKYPNSFKATLSQLGNEGMLAFQNAEKKMIGITMSLGQLPDKLHEAYSMLDEAPIEILADAITIPIESIDTLISRCLSLAAEAEGDFNRTQSLLLEILEATQMKKGEEEQRVQEVAVMIEEKKRNKATMKAILSEAELEKNNADKDMNESKTTYEEAVNSIPSSWTLLLQHAIKTGLNIFEKTFTGPATILNSVTNSAQKSNGNPEAVREQLKQHTETDAVEVLDNELSNCYEALNGFLNPNEDESLADINDTAAIKKCASLAAGMLKVSENKISRAKVAPALQTYKDKALKLIKSAKAALEVFEDEAKIQKDLNDQVKKLTKLQSDINDLIASNTVSVPAPSASNATTTSPAASTTEDPTKRVTVEERKAALAQKNLQRAQDRANEARKMVNEARLQLDNILNAMAKLDVTKIELDEIINITTRALDHLEQLKINWARLLKFFTLLSGITQNFLHGEVVEFRKFVDEILKVQEKEKTNTSAGIAYYMDKLVCREYTVLQVSKYLHIMSSTYVTVSEKYFMPHIGGITTMLNLKDENERTAALGKLKTEATDMGNAISKLATEQYDAYDRWVKAKKAKPKALLLG